MSIRKKRKGVILTATSLEYDSVREHLHDIQVIEDEPRIYEKGVFSGYSCDWEIIIKETGQLYDTAAIETTQAIVKFKPEIIMLVGTAGGIKLKDLKLGDVIAATRICNYETGDDQGHYRPDVFWTSRHFQELAKYCGRNLRWIKRIKNNKGGVNPCVHVGPITTGAKIIRDRESVPFKAILSHCNDALAVEMEGCGFLKAVQEHPMIHSMVVRGISDLISDKDLAERKGSREQAMHNASAFAFELIYNFDGVMKKKTFTEREIIKIHVELEKSDIHELKRDEIRSPQEILKDLPQEDILPIMAKMVEYHSFSDQISYAETTHYVEKYSDSIAEKELQVIGLHVLKNFEAVQNFSMVLDIGCANCGQYKSLMAARMLQENPNDFSYIGLDFNKEWDEHFFPAKGQFVHGIIPNINYYGTVDLIICAHVFHYLAWNQIGIYTSLLAFNRILKKNGMCYITIPEKESQPGMRELLEKAARDSYFQIIRSERCRITHRLARPPKNITTFSYLILKKIADIDPEKMNLFLGFSLIRGDCTKEAKKVGISTLTQIPRDIRCFEKELELILHEKDLNLKALKLALDITSEKRKVQRTTKEQMIDKLNIINRYYLEKSKGDRKQKLEQACRDLLLLIVDYILPVDNEKFHYNIWKTYLMIKNEIRDQTGIRIKVDDFSEEQAIRILKYIFELCRSENIDLYDLILGEMTYSIKKL